MIHRALASQSESVILDLYLAVLGRMHLGRAGCGVASIESAPPEGGRSPLLNGSGGQSCDWNLHGEGLEAEAQVVTRWASGYCGGAQEATGGEEGGEKAGRATGEGRP